MAEETAEVDWKDVAERLYRGFFGRCRFTERYMADASLDGRSWGVWTVDGRRQSDGFLFRAIAVDEKSDIGECYKSHVENFCLGMYSNGDGARTPKIEWSSDEELLFKLRVGGFL